MKVISVFPDPINLSDMRYLLILLIIVMLTASGGNCFAASQVDDVETLDWLDDDPFSEDLGGVAEKRVSDPLEYWNRIVFQFNDNLYYWVIEPVHTVYSVVLPLDFRRCFGNFFYNLASPIRFLNNILQGDLADAGAVLSRFVINSTLGVYGFGDVAMQEFDINPRPGDLGQTLGVWGMGEGLYLCLPIIGPSNLRDAVGFVGDSYSHPIGYLHDGHFMSNVGYYSHRQINTLSLNPNVYDDLKSFSLDPYISMRQVYLDYRRALIAGGKMGERPTDNSIKKIR